MIWSLIEKIFMVISLKLFFKIINVVHCIATADVEDFPKASWLFCTIEAKSNLRLLLQLRRTPRSRSVVSFGISLVHHLINKSISHFSIKLSKEFLKFISWESSIFIVLHLVEGSSELSDFFFFFWERHL